jgi:hypothetical protein
MHALSHKENNLSDTKGITLSSIDMKHHEKEQALNGSISYAVVDNLRFCSRFVPYARLFTSRLHPPLPHPELCPEQLEPEHDPVFSGIAAAVVVVIAPHPPDPHPPCIAVVLVAIACVVVVAVAMGIGRVHVIVHCQQARSV